MKLSGCTIIKDGIKLGYPFVESIKSVLPVCEEMIVCVGKSKDNTRKEIADIGSPKIKIFDTEWNSEQRDGGMVLSEQTNLALSKCNCEWIFYIQADELLHEEGFDKIRKALEFAEPRSYIDGLFFDFVHFYGSYYTVQAGRNWYKHEVRVIRNNRGIKSHGDAQGFRKNGKKIKALGTGAEIYHYGWARPPDLMLDKIKSFHRFWHDDVWIEKNCGNKTAKEFFSDLGNLKDFKGTHPLVIKEKLNHDNEAFIKACKVEYLKQRGVSDRIRDFFRGLPVGEHKNFKPVAHPRGVKQVDFSR
ncbi:MAG: hypothetical protein JW871_01110 [Endomicrobiales bacterium]|nr:hypothetical protein [Endomicrobiales bacterium]